MFNDAESLENRKDGVKDVQRTHRHAMTYHLGIEKEVETSVIVFLLQKTH